MAALELFGTEGYHAVPTSKIAKRAGVSEALIFRHFENKEGLLQAIMTLAEEKIKVLFADIVMTTDAKAVIRKALELPFIIPETEYQMWRLTYALKWQIDSYNSKKAEPLKLALTHAFKKLGYKQPDIETEIVLIWIDGAAASLLLHKPGNTKTILKALLAKYEV